MNIIAVGNQKGGVGKSTLVHNLGDILAAEHHLRILLIDCDPQASLTALCGVSIEQNGIVELMRREMAANEVITSVNGTFDLISSAIDLAQVETELINTYRREDRLKQGLAKLDQAYDLCLIDCPPSLSIMTVNALAAANSVLIPTLPQITDVRGLLMFLDTIDQIRTEINPELVILGVILNLFNARLNHHSSVNEELANLTTVVPVQIGRSIRVAEAGIEGLPLRLYDSKNKQLTSYRELALWLKSVVK